MSEQNIVQLSLDPDDISSVTSLAHISSTTLAHISSTTLAHILFFNAEMWQQSIVQLSLDPDDHFFHHIEQSVRASAITPRRASNGHNARLQRVPSIRSTRRVTPCLGDLSLTGTFNLLR